MYSNQTHTGSYYKLPETCYFDIILAIICSGFFVSLFAGHYFKNYQLLHALNVLKLLVIPLLSLCIYRYYKTGSKTILFTLLFSLLITWFWGFDFTYRWDDVQHVARSKYYLSHSYFGSAEERHSFLYLIWGEFYRLFGESETLTHLVNMFLGICGVFGIYAISKELYDNFTAFVALLFSLTFPAFFLVNKWAYLDMPFTSFVIITFLFLFKYLNTGLDRFFYLSMFFAFISYGTKDPGLVLFPAILACLFIYHRIDLKALISISLMLLISVLYYFKVMYYSAIMAEFSIITPLTFGIDTVAIWAGFLRQEVSQYIYTGILFLSVFAFLKTEKKTRTFLYVLLLIQVLLLIISENYPSKLIFSFPLFPWGNYTPYYILLGLSVVCLLISIILRQTEINVDKRGAAMLIWAASLTAFFTINGRVVDYGLRSLLDVSVLDFRYLMPAMPALIILFSSGISKILGSEAYSEKSKFIVLLVIALTLIFNFIIATNLTFYYANSGNLRAEGYKELKEQNPEVVYTHWPFYYKNGYNIGEFAWVKDNITVKDIHSNYFDSTKDGTFLLFDTYCYSPDRLVEFNSKKIEAKTYLLSPLSTQITEETVNSVYIVKPERGSMVLMDGFYSVEYWDNKPTRWMGNSSTLCIYSDKNMNTTLSMKAESFYCQRTLEVYVNGNPVSTNTIPTSFVNVESSVNLRKGMNFIKLATVEGSDRPCDFPNSNPEDTRYLSVAIQDIKLS